MKLLLSIVFISFFTTLIMAQEATPNSHIKISTKITPHQPLETQISDLEKTLALQKKNPNAPAYVLEKVEKALEKKKLAYQAIEERKEEMAKEKNEK